MILLCDSMAGGAAAYCDGVSAVTGLLQRR